MIDFNALEQITQDELFWEGLTAQAQGLSINDNPYKVGTLCSYYWDEGWEYGKEGH